MKNSSIWLILAIMGLAVGVLYLNNYRQDRKTFDEFDDAYDVNDKYEPVIYHEEETLLEEVEEATEDETKTTSASVSKTTVSTGVFESSTKKPSTCSDSGNLDCAFSKRVAEIRSTGNTDVSKRTGKIYYVSADGDDSNNGLSPSTPFKTMAKISRMFNHNQIAEGSTILFRDGDLFRGGQIAVKVNNILIGSYGDISKGKPTLTRSLYDGAKDGNWVEVKPNIWKYQIDGNSNLFTADVGVIWFFCDNGNNNCSKSLNTLGRKYSYGQKMTTYLSYDETDIESKIDTILKNDLEFYHVGHANASNSAQKGGAIYLYSKGNPKNRFSEIEFANGGGIFFKGPSGYVDNIRIMFIGNHGINANTLSNLVVTNSELGFIGGATQSYNDSGKPIRYGNGIEIYGSVKDVNGGRVTDGFVLKNNYVYEVYDAALTFQLSSSSVAHMEKANFINNVVENYNYGVEYWMFSSSTDQSNIAQSYINVFEIQNNLFRNAGVGASQTRPDKGCSAHIKTWNHDATYNIVKGKFEIKNNTFGYALEQYMYLRSSDANSMPKIFNNTFYGKSTNVFGYYFSSAATKKKLYLDETILNTYFSPNTYVLSDKKTTNNSGRTGDVSWLYDSSDGSLKITGTGAMADYTSTNLPPWYNLKESIYKIEIGFDVTKLGNYAFYNLTRVNEIRINAKKLADLPGGTNDGTNYTFYHTGSDTAGTKLIFGSGVTYIPAMLMKPTSDGKDGANISSLTFEGNKISAIGKYGLAHSYVTALKLPGSVKTVSSLSLGRNKKMKFLVAPSITSLSSGWSIAETLSEKMVFGSTIAKVKDATFRNCTSLKTLVIPDITDTAAYNGVFYGTTQTINIYGNGTVKTWVSNLTKAGQTNLVYHPLSEYKSTVKSNTGINKTVAYNGTYTFTTDKNVSIKMYYDASDGKRYSVNADYTKDGSTYTIKNIIADIYIEIK